MILDNEDQRTIILKMIEVVNFPGEALEQAYQLKQAVKSASVQSEEPK